MKKVVALILVLVMCLSLCACTKVEDAVVGTWGYDIEDRDNARFMTIYPGGSGELEFRYSYYPAYHDLAWEVTDGVFNVIDLENNNRIEGFTYDAKNDTLTSMANGRVYERIIE